MQDPQNRERAIERLLPQTLAAMPPAQAACVDAETLAAWASGTLRASEAATIESHLADCGHCQAVLGTFVRTTPPSIAESVWSRWQLRWLVPLATAATAVTLYLLVPAPEPERRAEQVVSVAEAPRDTSADAASVGTPSPSAAAPGVAAPSATEGDSPASAPVTRAEPARPQAKQTKEEQEFAQRTDSDRARARDNLAAAAPNPAPAPLAESAPSALMRDAPKPESVARQERSAEALSARPAAPPAAVSAPPPAVAAGAAAASERRADAAVGIRQQAAVNIEIATPVPSHRFRIVSGQHVERTTTGGQTWEAVARPVAGEMTAGAAPAIDVCWIVGRTGAVWRTTDGQLLVRIPFPQQVDLVAVAAESADVATVTAADGRTFRTANGGQTWK